MYLLKEKMAIRQVAGEYIAVPVGSSRKNMNGMLNLSESGKLIMERLKEGAEYDSLVELLTDTYDVSKEQAAKDVKQFLEALEEIQLVECTD